MSVAVDIYAADDDTEQLESLEYTAQEGDDFREGVSILETTLAGGTYRIVAALLDQDGIAITTEEQWLVMADDYELSLQLGRELCQGAYTAPLLSDTALLAACQDKSWFECSQAADALCTASSELNAESCWIGGFAYLQGETASPSVRVLCLGYSGARRLQASLNELSNALGESGAQMPLDELSVTTRRGSTAVHEYCLDEGFGGGVGPLLVDEQREVHFLCLDRDLATVESARDSFFDASCGYATMPESQACSEEATNLCKVKDHAFGFGPVTAPEESTGAIETVCF